MPEYYADPPQVCNICDGPFDGIMIDGTTKPYGTWANMCAACFHEHGYGLGTGKGQQYTQQEDGRWLKTGG